MNTATRVRWRLSSSHLQSVACVGKGASKCRTRSYSTTARRSYTTRNSQSYHPFPSSVREASNIPSQVRIVEVGPRDGLQNEATIVSVQDKVQLVQMLAMAGCPHIEVGSFVSPKWVPSMANSIEVMQEIQMWREMASTLPSTSKSPVFSCLVPNTEGLQHAIQVGADEIAIFGSASESFSQKGGSLLLFILCAVERSFFHFSFSHVDNISSFSLANDTHTHTFHRTLIAALKNP